MPDEKCVVLHDGFELMSWKDFMQEEKYAGVVLDTHQYLMMAKTQGCEQTVEGCTAYAKEHYEKAIEEMQNYFPVICGEWCLFNSLACGCDTKGGQSGLNGQTGAAAEKFNMKFKPEIYQHSAGLILYYDNMNYINLRRPGKACSLRRLRFLRIYRR